MQKPLISDLELRLKDNNKNYVFVRFSLDKYFEFKKIVEEV